MIQITDKSRCVGCAACVQRCPKQCISLHEDGEGFLYPVADASLCVDCGLCEWVCPVLHPGDARRPLESYAAVNPDADVRRCSSSGGAFTVLAEAVIRRGGVVFGARFDERWEVAHDWTDTSEGLAAFRGSKYVQSRMGDSYVQAERFLKSGREVLFSGTPCQIAGLRLFLRKPYEGLLTTVDFICHGVPSPGVWRKYLSEEVARQRNRKNTVSSRPIHGGDALVEGISFRDKMLGWKKFSFALVLSTTNGSGEKFSFSSRMPLNKNPFLRGFLADLYLRPSCHACPSKELRSGSDLTLADYWGVSAVHPELDDDLGVSVLLVNTPRGRQAVAGLPADALRLTPTDFDAVALRNPALLRPAAIPPKRARFFAEVDKPVIGRVERLLRGRWLKQKVRSVLRRLLVASGVLKKRNNNKIGDNG